MRLLRRSAASSKPPFQARYRPPASDANPRSLPPAAPKGRPLIGVALEGGGALGLAHIGVLQWFEEHRIPVDRISGTSMGSLVGAFYATGRTPAQMRALAVSDAFTRVFTLQTPYADLSFRRRQDRRELPAGAHRRPAPRGLPCATPCSTDRGVNEFLTTNLPDVQQPGAGLRPAPHSLSLRGHRPEHPASRSPLPPGRCPRRCAPPSPFPASFLPCRIATATILVDGGILDNLPTDVLKRDLHADIMIAIHLEDAASADTDTSSIVGVLNRAFDAGIEHNVAQAERLADVVVEVPVGQVLRHRLRTRPPS